VSIQGRSVFTVEQANLALTAAFNASTAGERIEFVFTRESRSDAVDFLRPPIQLSQLKRIHALGTVSGEEDFASVSATVAALEVACTDALSDSWGRTGLCWQIMNWCITSVVKLQPTSLHLVTSPVASSSSFLSGIYGMPQNGYKLTLSRSKRPLASLTLPHLVPGYCVPIGITSRGTRKARTCFDGSKRAAPELMKPCGTRKARMCRAGSKHAAPKLRFVQTYVSCIDQPCMRLFSALSAAIGLIVMGADCAITPMPTPRRLPKRHTSGLTAPMPISIALAVERLSTTRWYY
jgi:hypothetical protein